MDKSSRMGAMLGLSSAALLGELARRPLRSGDLLFDLFPRCAALAELSTGVQPILSNNYGAGQLTRVYSCFGSTS